MCFRIKKTKQKKTNQGLISKTDVHLSLPFHPWITSPFSRGLFRSASTTGNQICMGHWGYWCVPVGITSTHWKRMGSPGSWKPSTHSWPKLTSLLSHWLLLFWWNFISKWNSIFSFCIYLCWPGMCSHHEMYTHDKINICPLIGAINPMSVQLKWFKSF